MAGTDTNNMTGTDTNNTGEPESGMKYTNENSTFTAKSILLN